MVDASKIWFWISILTDGNSNGNDDENESYSQLYRITDQKCRKITKFMGYYLMYHACPFISPLIFAIVGLRSGQTDMSAYILPFQMVLPFDTLSIDGWCLEWFIQLNVGLSYALCMIIATNHFIFYCYNIVAICIHFQLLMDSIRDDVEQIQSKYERQQSHRSPRQKIREKLANSVAIHDKSIEY